MAFKKTITSNADVVIGGNGPLDALFPPGFKYMSGDVIYTVTKRFYADNTEFRRLVTSDGATEDVTVATIVKDLKTKGAEILDDPMAKAKEAESKSQEKTKEGEE